MVYGDFNDDVGIRVSVGLKLQPSWTLLRDLGTPNFVRGIGTFNRPVVQPHICNHDEKFPYVNIPSSLTVQSISTPFGPSNCVPNNLVIRPIIAP